MTAVPPAGAVMTSSLATDDRTEVEGIDGGGVGSDLIPVDAPGGGGAETEGGSAVLMAPPCLAPAATDRQQLTSVPSWY